MENFTDLQNPVFSICVPTYNRGLTVLTMVVNLLPTLDDNWELLILDNASTHEADSYQKVAQFTQLDPRLRYVRHDSNRGFQGNMLAAFDHARSAHIMLISDEDFANPAMIRKVLPRLQAAPDLAVMRGSVESLKGQIPRNTCKQQNKQFAKGSEALLNFCLNNTYLSGIIFNRALLIKSGVIDILRTGIQANSIYPHLYLELLACALFDAESTEEIACFEGEEKLSEGNQPNEYRPPYSFGSRIDQFIVLRNSIHQAVSLMPGDFDHQLFMQMYLRLCHRYMRLISLVNKSLYINNHLHLGLLQDSLFQIMGAAIFAYPELAFYGEGLFAAIQKIYSEFKIKDTSTSASPEHQAEAA